MRVSVSHALVIVATVVTGLSVLCEARVHAEETVDHHTLNTAYRNQMAALGLH